MSSIDKRVAEIVLPEKYVYVTLIRSIGLFRSADEAELREVLDSLPLHVWMKVNVTPLTPHPNDPELHAHQATDYPHA